MHRYPLAGAVLVLSTTLAHAHPGHATNDLIHGFLHPLSGLDHVLAMVAVGLLAAQLGGRALWLVPAAFVVTMGAAAVAGMTGHALIGSELGIALSLLVLGAAVAARIGMPTGIAAALVAVFAVFHGYAHGAELPASVSALGYGAGFIAASVLLHAVGITLGLLLGVQRTGDYALRLAGGAVAIAGAVLMVGLG